MGNVTKHVVPNGLTVLLKEVHSAPLISWWVLYKIGSRNERTGQTGVSHWVEHMMFKGTDAFPASDVMAMFDRLGGMSNAQTSFDYTAYFETVPADKIDLAIRHEADRMVNAKFDPAEVDSERTVIISERQGLENSPLFWLAEEISAAAFRVHGYHHEIIGDLHDLNTMSRDDLYNHYRTYYAPNNAVISAVGAFDTSEMIERISEVYGNIPARDVPQLFSRTEPEQHGERRIRVERPGTTAFLEFAYRAPAGNDPDFYALTILNSVLTGPDGNIDNKTSRLYRALVESEIAASVSGSLMPSIDPYLYSITITIRTGRSVEEAEAVFESEIQRVLDGDITEAEVRKAKKQARAAFAYSTESVTGQAYWLAYGENLGSFEWFDQYVDKLDQVSLENVLDAAKRYLRPQSRVVGHLIPTGMSDESEEFSDDDQE
ncbi:MAG: insulinase family protein [Chloroflexi bacterium]|nr:insulinase family protein [Chloroflexota bacterium]